MLCHPPLEKVFLMTAFKRRLSVNFIFEQLQEHIISGQYRPGQRLGEVDLATQYGVSRGPIRDALRRLAGVGLVTSAANIGAQVRSFSLAEGKAFYQLREALEGQVARLAASNAGEQEKQKIERLLKEHVQVINVHPDRAYLQEKKDRDFHLVLAEIAANPLIQNLLANELYPQLMLLRSSHCVVKGRGAQAFLEHQRIAEAIYANDEELACLLMQRHVQASWQTFFNGQQGDR